MYRDNHAWCPYCQKVWLFLEEKRVDYKIAKVTMFCYGEKEAWYKRICPSGMLPALALDGKLITESDDILIALESQFGPLGHSMQDKPVVMLRRLERALFGAWCDWLCRPSRGAADEARKRAYFEEVCNHIEIALGATADAGDYFMGDFSVVDVVFTPYVERMNASLFYYKGFQLRDPKARPYLCAWFDAMERRPTYLGTQSDYHTHVHDLPPQMGGCFESGDAKQMECRNLVDHGPWLGLRDTGAPEPETSVVEAVSQVLRHKDNVLRANPNAGGSADEALRCALTLLIQGECQAQPPAHADVNLRYIRDRVNVPRDMSLWAARRFRAALEDTASRCGTRQSEPIPIKHRRDQDSRAFKS